MSSQSLILHGKSGKSNLKAAYYIAENILNNGNISKYIETNSYPDFMFLKKAPEESSITIENIRKIGEFLSQKAEFGKYKVVAIDSAETMNSNSANSILKILEEPPAKSVIVLTTTKLFSLLPTIRSRCKRIHVSGSSDIRYSNHDDFFKHCVNFLDSGNSNIVGFSKTISPDQLDIFLDIILRYAYNKFTTSLSVNDAENYIRLDNLISQSKNTHLDPQNLVAACCLYVV